MKHKSIRLFTVLICCLAIPLVASAAQDNKKKKQGQQNQQAQHQGQAGGKRQNAGNQNMMNKGNKGANNPNKPKNANMANQGNQWNKANKGNKGMNKPNQPNKQNMANQGNQWNKANKGNKGMNKPNQPNNPNMANQGNQWNKANKGNKGNKGINNPNSPNNPNMANKGKNWQKNANKTKWQTKHFDNIAKGPNKNIKSVTYQKNYKIKGAQNWQGTHYAAFRNYNSEWHDHDWWHNHYGRNIVLIGGGWYFLNNGFWAPAWGYNPAQAYYPYNGPIYAYRNLPPDQVIANVQASLQEQGYYTGEVDGLLGPLTQDALVNFQNNNGLAPTGSIDQPTLDALGMS